MFDYYYRIALQCLLYLDWLRIRLKKNVRRWWVRDDITVAMREQFGAYSTVFLFFKFTNEEQFKKFVGLTVPQFDTLHEMVHPFLQKQSIRKPLSTELRLACVLK